MPLKSKEEKSAENNHNIKVAVITGNHPFDVIAFHEMLKSLSGIDFYIQDLENLIVDTEKVFNNYDVYLFYNFHMATPEGNTKKMLESLIKNKKGVVILHHALLAFPKWPLWSKMCDIDNREFKFFPDQTIKVKVDNTEHPITKKLKSWVMIDETYIMKEASENSQILLSTNHAKSMRTLAWTRELGKTRIFCYASGHGKETFEDNNFRKILKRGIQWVSRKI